VWKFDASEVDIVFIQINTTSITSGEISYGDGGDLIVDTGERTNDTSIVDQGLRIIDGSI